MSDEQIQVKLKAAHSARVKCPDPNWPSRPKFGRQKVVLSISQPG